MLPPQTIRTLVDLIEWRAAATSAQVAFHWNDRPWTYGDLGDRVGRFAGCLSRRGVVRGDRVLVSLPNGPDFFAAFHGVLRAGGIAVPIFPGSGVERAASLAQRCGARVLVGAVAGGAKVSGLDNLDVADSLDTPPEAATAVCEPADVAFLQYTSGTTGTPKGVCLTHGGLLTNMGQLIDGMSITPDDRFVSWLPVFHDMGLILMTMVPFFLGAQLVLLPTTLANVRPWLSAIERYRGTLTAAPDIAYRIVLRSVRDPSSYDLSSLRVALNAAEPVRRRTIEGFERAFGLGPVVIAGYGLAEATVGVSTWPAGQPPLVDDHGIVSVGRPFRDVDVKILDQDAPVGPGRVGEIVVQSPANTPGYFGDEGETARLRWGAGYIRTGDLGYLDAAGRLFVTGRMKNIIKQGGETIFPQEAEESADALPNVRRSAAVGIDAGGPEGEQMFLFVEPFKPGTMGQEELRDTAVAVVQSVRARLGIRPARVYLLAPHTIPLTHNGKIQHGELRRMYMSGSLRAQGAILFPGY